MVEDKNIRKGVKVVWTPCLLGAVGQCDACCAGSSDKRGLYHGQIHAKHDDLMILVVPDGGSQPIQIDNLRATVVES